MAGSPTGDNYLPNEYQPLFDTPLNQRTPPCVRLVLAKRCNYPEFVKRTLSALSEFSQGTCGFIGQAVTRGELIAAATPYTAPGR